MFAKLIITTSILLVLSSSLKLRHDYYSLQTAEQVDSSQSIKELNKCKTQCLQMKTYFPFQFRFHRYILRQTNGMVKYFIGDCQVKMLSDTYESWDKLKAYIDATNLFGEKDFLNQGQDLVWQNYKDVCQNIKLKIDQNAIIGLDLTRTHSNFVYYDDGKFENLEPFNDINGMLANLHTKTV